MENDAEIFPVHYTWKVAEKGFKMAFMMDHNEIQVRSILVCALYLIKYSIWIFQLVLFTFSELPSWLFIILNKDALFHLKIF